MQKITLFLILCICHVVGDYFMQSERLSGEKTQRFIAVFRHVLLYGVPFLVCVAAAQLMGEATGTLLLLIACVVLHTVVDVAKYALINTGLAEKCFRQTSKERINQVAYIVDQLIHIACLLIICVAYKGQLPQIPQYITTVIPHILYFMCLLKPANVTFKILFRRFQVKANDENIADDEQPKDGAGAWIGNMERLLSGIFVLLGQFAAIGLIMTAKSIARYDQIAKRPAFAEYYLIGTLYSILYTIILYYLFFRITV